MNELQKHKQSLYRYWKNSRMITSERILDAFMEVPRELFIETSFGDQAYADHPLPIGEGQTISQPTTVMLMLQLLELFPGQRVLEVGAGCGYNAALLGQLASHVITIERHEKLAELARRNLKKIGISNVTVIAGDGKFGHQEGAPYERIIITAAARKIPFDLKQQLAEDGMLLSPVGQSHGCDMIRIRKITPTNFQSSSHGLFSFVPLV